MGLLMISRRHALCGTAATAALLTAGATSAFAADKVYRIGITLPLTGADAEAAHLILNGALLAIKLANSSGELKGITLEPMVLNNARANWWATRRFWPTSARK
ncbi:ABC transporter substrate-binding protein [Acidiphilium sp. 34-64-41]|uniref:ABC transporter substrate-binding protein n=1 Tax=Acidiphilium sp. 34-64-41 TaxID=1970297 RepID=UPI00257CE714|nr:hypothetical protein [Acidiphilium sp. 34-64-41]